jgi:hypothetical protein
MNRLAILICHLPERHDKLKRLLNVLEPQIERFKDQVYYSVHDGGRALSTGSKRNQLIEQTQSEFFCAIDDDDMVPSYYVDEIVKAMNQNPDVITFKGVMTTNGARQEYWTIKLGSNYEEKNGHYYRWPNHIVPMKRELVRHIKFPDVWIQEDYIWSKKIHDLGLLKTEIHIDKDLYHYQVESKAKPESVYHRRGLR